jgi:hypothetical protein
LFVLFCFVLFVCHVEISQTIHGGPCCAHGIVKPSMLVEAHLRWFPNKCCKSGYGARVIEY